MGEMINLNKIFSSIKYNLNRFLEDQLQHARKTFEFYPQGTTGRQMGLVQLKFYIFLNELFKALINEERKE